jgi:zinc/manganese transport system substrate-binding protein
MIERVPGRLRKGALTLVVASLAVLTGACGLAGVANSSAKVEVVAAENFWGSIATQIGGDKVHVVSIINNPATDPHDYEPKPDDARKIAVANYVIVNGAGYDSWAGKLLSANPVSGRQTLDIGDLVGVREGGNPHVWYSPDYVNKVIDRITADLKKLDSGDAGYFDTQSSNYKSSGLKAYSDTIAAIKKKYTGVPVGATESIFVYIAQATGLNLITPPDYMKAISEGTDPSAGDKATVDQQVAGKKVKVLVFNTQNSTPSVQAVATKAKALNIPVVEITETMTPATASFQDWQASQLKALLKALGG